jgi:hypothetical protein
MRTPALEWENKTAAEIQHGQENYAREPLHEAEVHRGNKNSATAKLGHGPNNNRRKSSGTKKNLREKNEIEAGNEGGFRPAQNENQMRENLTREESKRAPE